MPVCPYDGPDYDRAAMLGRYEEIVQQIRKKLPETKLYLLAYYPVNPTVAEDPGLIECFRWRTNERIREAVECAVLLCGSSPLLRR